MTVCGGCNGGGGDGGGGLRAYVVYVSMWTRDGGWRKPLLLKLSDSTVQSRQCMEEEDEEKEEEIDQTLGRVLRPGASGPSLIQ